MNKEQQYKLAVEYMVDAINLILSEQINEYYDYIIGEWKRYMNNILILQDKKSANILMSIEELVDKINDKLYNKLWKYFLENVTEPKPKDEIIKDIDDFLYESNVMYFILNKDTNMNSIINLLGYLKRTVDKL